MVINLINENESQYLNLLSELVALSDQNVSLENRTDTKAYKVFGRTLEFDLSGDKLPLLTTKKIKYTNILHELIWMFILKNPNTSYLDSNDVRIWNEWKVPVNNGSDFTIGEMYGQLLRNYKFDYNTKESPLNVDQLAEVIQLLKTTPNTRRAVFTLLDPRATANENESFAANVNAGKGVLNACHGNINQFDINSNGDLEFITYQRSADVFLGLPYNIAFYATFCHMVASVLGRKCTKMIYHLGNTHLYENCLDQARIQLERTPYRSPTLNLNTEVKNFDDFTINDFTLYDYESHPFIKASVAV